MRRVGTIDVAVTFLAIAWTVLFATLGLLQYETGHNASFDLALYARSLWGVSHGMPFNPLRDQQALALHSHAVLYLLAPFAWVVSPVYLLLTLQAISLGGGGLVLYVISKRRIGSETIAACVTLSYFLYPVAANTALFDMHPKTLAMIPILYLLDGLDRDPDTTRSLWKAAAWMLLCFACREDTALCFGVIGIYWLVVLRRFRAGLLLVVLSAAFFLSYELVVRPALGADFASTRAHFGALNAVSALDRADLGYVLLLVGGFAFLPLLGPRFAIGAIVPIVINVVSDFPGTNTIQSHYAFLTLPFLVLGSVYGLSRLDQPAKLQRVAAVSMLLAAFGVGVYGSEGPGGRSFDRHRFSQSESSRAVQPCIGAISPEGGVYAPIQWAAHFADRPVIRHTFGSADEVDALDFILLEQAPIPYFARADGYSKYMAERQRQMMLLQQRHGFTIAQRCGPYVLLTR